MTTNPPRYVIFDVMSEDPDWYFVLTSALGDYAACARAEASEGGPTAAACIRWAETAEDALHRIEVALAAVPESVIDVTPDALDAIFARWVARAESCGPQAAGPG